NQVRQKELFDAFQVNFPKGFLEKYESNFNGEDEHNWLKVLTRNEKRHVHPLRHLFFLYFLGKDVEELFRVREDLGDRKSTRLNSSHVSISYAVFCLKK